MDARRFTGGSYLRQEDLEGEQLVTIARVDETTFEDEGGERKKLVVYFEEFENGLVCNATNTRRLTRACGGWDTDKWPGKRAILYVDEDVEFGGRIVGGIRVRRANESEHERN